MTGPRRYIQLRVDRPVEDIQVVGGLEAFSETTIDNVNIDFDVVADRTAGPNTMDVSVYNLSEDTRYRLRKSPRAKVSLRFGYSPDNMFVLFRGDLRSSIVVRENNEIITKIEAGAGERMRNKWVSKKYTRNTRLMEVVTDLVDEMGVGRGNVDKIIEISETEGMPLSLQKGFAANGHAADIFARLMGSRGIEWSIQTIGGKEVLQIIQSGSAISDAQAIPLLAPGKGLIGIPAIDSDNVMTCEALIRDDIYPGRLVDIESRFLGDKRNKNTSNARFKVTRAQYSGSLYGECKASLEGRKVIPK